MTNKNIKIFSKEQATKDSLNYFNKDQLATNCFLDKYALKNKNGELLEDTPDMMHERLASEFARIEQKYPNPLTKEEIYNWFKNFKYIVPQGSPMFGIGNNYVLASLSNCVVVSSPKDSISGIFDTGKDLANLFKYRCGVGADISTLRPTGKTVNNSAKTTTGACTFVDFYSYIVNMIGQAGRRGALLLSIDCNSPSIEQFVSLKTDLKKATGANLSVKISNKFMQAVKENKMFPLVWNDKIEREINARELFDKIVSSATACGEPGVLFWDSMLETLPLECYADDGFKHIGVNPCSEICLFPYDSCRLMSINLSNFAINEFENNAAFDWEKFTQCTKVAQRLADDLIDLEIEKLDKIIESADEQDVKDIFVKLKKSALLGRRIGISSHGLADLLVKLQLKYDSEDAIKFVDKLYETLKNEIYSASALLANERGFFPIYKPEKEENNKFINNLSDKTKELMKQYGRRNGSLLTVSPTGTVSIVCQTSSGIEPIFKLEYTRRVRGKEENNWNEYSVLHPSAQNWLNKNNKNNIKDLPNYFVTAEQIDPMMRVKMQATIQKHIDHSISSTVNLPKGTTVETVKNIYMNAWESGCKGITVYVDGSRDNILSAAGKENNKNKSFSYYNAQKRPKELSCDIHITSIAGETHIVLIGLYDGKPYEVFAGLQNKIKIPKIFKAGKILKNEKKTLRSTYDLCVGCGDNELIVSDIVEQFDNPNNLSLCRMISLALRHGANPKYVMEQLQKDKNSDLFSFGRGIARILKTYVLDGESANGILKECPNCKNNSLVYQNGCVSCSCSWTKCS